MTSSSVRFKLFPGIAVAVGALGLVVIGCASSATTDPQSLAQPTAPASGKDAGKEPAVSAFASGATTAEPASAEVTPGSACVTSKTESEGVRTLLVFMFDRSLSMDDDAKWTTCSTGLKAFFADPNGKGLGASLSFFPQHPGGQTDASCAVADYTTPAVPMTALPDPSFAAAIDGAQREDLTPTLPALNGAIAYAGQVSATKSGAKVAIVLVTDGQPNVCNSTVQAVAAAAKSVSATIPTYVIGVGSSLGNLDAIAAGGGTGKAVLVDTASPDQIAADFQKALGHVKAQALSCELALPAPPAGQTLDPTKVNVAVTAEGGAQTTLTYDGACASGKGWHYDNAAAPTKLVLCPATCDEAKGDAVTKLEILFGCEVKGTIK